MHIYSLEFIDEALFKFEMEQNLFNQNFWNFSFELKLLYDYM